MKCEIKTERALTLTFNSYAHRAQLLTLSRFAQIIPLNRRIFSSCHMDDDFDLHTALSVFDGNVKSAMQTSMRVYSNHDKRLIIWFTKSEVDCTTSFSSLCAITSDRIPEMRLPVQILLATRQIQVLRISASFLRHDL